VSANELLFFIVHPKEATFSLHNIRQNLTKPNYSQLIYYLLLSTSSPNQLDVVHLNTKLIFN